MTPKIRVSRRAAAGDRAAEAIEEAVVTMVRGRASRVRLIFGGATEAVNLVAARVGRVAAAHEAFSAAHWQLVGSGDDAARIIFRKTASELRSELRTAAAAAPDVARDAERALREVDDLARRVRSRSGRLASGRINPNWWDRLFDLARADANIRRDLAAFQDACATGDADALAAAARQLIASVSPKLSMSQARAFTDRINGTVRQLSATAATGDGARALVALADFVDELHIGAPARPALLKLSDAVRDHGDRWFAVANVVAGMKRATTPEAARAMLWRVKGMLGEMLAMSTPAYRAYYKAALADADALVKRLNATPPGGWEITTRRSQVRAPASADSARLAPFYDDAIIVRRVVPGEPNGEAIVVLATQVKSGDWSASGVVDQINSDIGRELGGLLELDRRPYRLVAAPPEFAPVRVFVGTSLPPPAAVADAAAPIHAVILPMSSDELEDVALAFLVANGLLP